VKKLLQQHYRIFTAIKNHSAEKARDRTLDHLNYVESEVKAFNGATERARSSAES
jgi:DNA-binding FadR family transcriptional regulator